MYPTSLKGLPGFALDILSRTKCLIFLRQKLTNWENSSGSQKLCLFSWCSTMGSPVIEFWTFNSTIYIRHCGEFNFTANSDSRRTRIHGEVRFMENLNSRRVQVHDQFKWIVSFDQRLGSEFKSNKALSIFFKMPDKFFHLSYWIRPKFISLIW